MKPLIPFDLGASKNKKSLMLIDIELTWELENSLKILESFRKDIKENDIKSITPINPEPKPSC